MGLAEKGRGKRLTKFLLAKLNLFTFCKIMYPIRVTFLDYVLPSNLLNHFPELFPAE